MVTLSWLYLPWSAWAGSPGITCSLPRKQRQVEPESRARLPHLGKVPATCFSGTSHFPSASGRGGRGARRRAGTYRPPPHRVPGGVVPAAASSGHDAAGDAEVTEGVSTGLKGFGAGPCPAARAGSAERPGRGALPTPRRERVPPSAGSLSLPSVSTCPPRPGTLSHGGGPLAPAAYEYVYDKCPARAGEEGGGHRTPRRAHCVFSRASPRVRVLQPNSYVVQLGPWQRVVWGRCCASGSLCAWPVPSWTVREELGYSLFSPRRANDYFSRTFFLLV